MPDMVVPKGVASRLERERDEALEKFIALSSWTGCLCLHHNDKDRETVGCAICLTKERDEARRELQVVLGSNSLRISAEIAKARNTEIEQLITERDALRVELQEWKDRVEALANELHGGAS